MQSTEEPISRIGDLLPIDVQITLMTWLPMWMLKIMTHSRHLRQQACSTLHRRVLEHLILWHLPPSDTLVLMRRTRTVISGWTALAVCNPAGWTAEFIHFFCPNPAMDEVLAWFHHHQYTSTDEWAPPSHIQDASRYDMDPEPGEEWMYWEVPRMRYSLYGGAERIITLTHVSGQRTIKLSQSYSESALMPILMMPTTLTMNLVTGDGVVSLYPRLTQRETGLLNLQLDPPHRPVYPETVAHLCDLQDEGYRLIQRGDPESERGPSEPRTWDDEQSVSMPFNQEHPVTLTPSTRWVLSSRMLTEAGYRDHDPVVFVKQDVDTVIYTENLHYFQDIEMHDHQ